MLRVGRCPLGVDPTGPDRYLNRGCVRMPVKRTTGRGPYGLESSAPGWCAPVSTHDVLFGMLIGGIFWALACDVVARLRYRLAVFFVLVAVVIGAQWEAHSRHARLRAEPAPQRETDEEGEREAAGP